MKPKSEKMLEYESPTAMPLGEAAKGAGQCNEGSAVLPSSPGTCSPGAGVYAAGCFSGTSGGSGRCSAGSNVYSPGTCSPGISG